MTTVAQNIIEMCEAILADPAEPKWRKEQAEENLRRHGHAARSEQRNEEIRTTLLSAAREARKLGYAVCSSKDRSGKISSYYAQSGNAKIRISDHVLPSTAKREAMNDFHGGTPFSGEIIIEGTLTATRLRRLITLAAAGRM